MVDRTYFQPGRYVESDSPEIVAFAHTAAGDASTPIETAVRLYYAVRDTIVYDPYQTYSRLETYSGRIALERRRGYCVSKAALLVACARALGIAARIGFADVRNHLATPRLLEVNGGDVFYWHAYADLWLEGKFVKATPAFNLSMCDRFGVIPLEFDGRNDSVFHAHDSMVRRHMEYLTDHGMFADVPVERILDTFRQHCPRLIANETFRGCNFTGEK
ncbi:MAG: transglutaminase family protein [Burkholderiaceae bacterium]|nr:transglutaminase family protein [Burkholderiaceae bacterium]